MKKPLVISWILILSISLSVLSQQPQAPSPAPPQQPPPPVGPTLRDASDQDVVRITTNLVQVDVVVTRDGKQVNDLKPEEFEIYEDGQRQTITNFAYVSNTTRVNYTSSSGSLTSTSPTGTESPMPPKASTPRQVGRTMAIVIDDLGMSFDSMGRVRAQLGKFISANLEPTDLVAIIRTGGEVGALQQFTTDRRLLQNAVASLKWNPCSRIGLNVLNAERSLTIHSAPGGLSRRQAEGRSRSSDGGEQLALAGDNQFCGGGASIYYTLRALRFILRGMSDLPGRKSMMVISDRLPTEQQQMASSDLGLKRPQTENDSPSDSSMQSTNFAGGLSRLAEIAIRSSVVIYGVVSYGLQTVGPDAADEISYPPLGVRRLPDQDVIARLIKSRTAELRRNMEGADMLAKQTGGFVIRNTNELGFERVLEDQGGYYLIGYRPAASTFDRRFHHIKAKVKRNGVTVRTRAGFYGVSEADAPVRPSTLRDRIDRALISPFGASEIDVRATPLFLNDPTRGSLLRLFLSLDANDLTFTEEADGTQVANLMLTTIFFGDNGAVVSKQDHKTTLRLRGRPYERAKREGVVYTFDIPTTDPGVFQFRLAVVDTASSRVGSAGQFLTVPDIKNNRLALSGILLQTEAPASAAAERPTIDETFLTTAALRKFRQGSSLVFGYTIYNATLDAARSARLLSQTIIFRDGKKVFTSDRLPVNTADQADLKRISAGARLAFGPALTPGEYVLQILVEDQVAKRTATQWIEFEVLM